MQQVLKCLSAPVHKSLWLGEKKLRFVKAEISMQRFSASTRESYVLPVCQLVEHHEANVVPVAGVRETGVAQPGN
jgi:hypothetical protein